MYICFFFFFNCFRVNVEFYLSFLAFYVHFLIQFKSIYLKLIFFKKGIGHGFYHIDIYGCVGLDELVYLLVSFLLTKELSGRFYDAYGKT